MFLKAGAVSLALLLASRLIGLVRESAQAAAFGTSGLADAAVLMLTLPDWITGVLASGALAYVLLPHWSRETPAQQAASQRRVAGVLLALGVVLGVVVWAARSWLLAALAPGLSVTLRPPAADALGWSALALAPALLAALWVTRLQHARDFTGLYGANLVVNGVLVVALFVVANFVHLTWTLAVLGMALVLAMGLRLVWLRWRLAGARSDAGDASTAGGVVGPSPGRAVVALPAASLWAWAALSAGLPLALPFAARSMASVGGEGALATFNYAWKLVELPLVLAIQLVATLAFPVVTRALAGDGDPALAVRRAFALAWTLACACAASLLVGAPAVAQLLFGWGRMDADGLARVAGWGAVAAWGLLPQALIAVALTVLAAQGRMKVAVCAYAGALAVLLVSGVQDGAQLMAVLNGVLSAVAAAVVWALGREARHWLPWRGALAPLGALLVLGAAVRLGEAVVPAWGTAAGLAAAAAAAIGVVAAAWLTGPDLRAALRR